MTIPFTITESASAYIKKMVEKANGMGFRLSIKKTGCSGFSYLPSVVSEVNAKDEAIILANGTKIFIDTTWKHLLTGVQIDYIEEEKSGLKQKRLNFTNPNEAARCGCGESFTTNKMSGDDA